MAWYDKVLPVAGGILGGPGGAITGYAASKLGGIDGGAVKDFLLGEQYEFDPTKYGNIEGSADIRSNLSGLAGDRAAPTAATGREDQFRALQIGLGQQLAGVAAGREKGPGEMAAERAGQQALRAQMAQGAATRGFGAGAVRSQLAGQGALMRTNLAGQAAQAGAADVQQARNTLAGLAAQGRGADQATSLANLQSQLQTTDQRLAATQQLMNLGLSEQQARLAAEQMAMGNQRQGLLLPLLQSGAQIGAAYAGAG